MPRKGENIYKRKDGRWEGRYKIGRKENGQLKYGYLYGPTYTNVKERLYSYKIKAQTLLEIYGDDATTYEEWGLFWLNRHQLLVKYSTYSVYLYKLKRYVFPTIGNVSLNQLTKEKIQELIENLSKQGLQATTIHVIFQILKKSLNDAIKQGKLVRNPCVDIILPRKKKVRAHAISKKEQVKLETEAKKAPLHKGLPILLALNAGLRIGEISALRWKNIDFERRVIQVNKTYQRIPVAIDKKKTQLLLDQSKTEQSIRTIPMTFTLYKYLKKWRKKSSGEFICSNNSKPSEPRLLTYYFHSIRQKVGLPKTHFHHLRHTFATRCIEANGDIASVSRLLGHVSSKTTLDIYTDSFITSQQQVISQMESA